jgi:type II secretory pathway pseudopilin PulG
MTLLELMIGMAIAAIVTGIAASTLVLAQRTTNQIEKSASAIDAARLLSAELDRELRSAVCILSPGENLSGNTLKFQTLAGEDVVVLTYSVAFGVVTRQANLEPSRTVITDVGSTTTAFKQVTTPLRTIEVNIPIRSDNGGEFNLQTTVAGRNAWRAC